MSFRRANRLFTKVDLHMMRSIRRHHLRVLLNNITTTTTIMMSIIITLTKNLLRPKALGNNLMSHILSPPSRFVLLKGQKLRLVKSRFQGPRRGLL